MSCPANYEENYRRGATYMDNIMKEAKPADLLEQPTKFELVINLKNRQPDRSDDSELSALPGG